MIGLGGARREAKGRLALTGVALSLLVLVGAAQSAQAGTLPDETIDARERFFGPKRVDGDGKLDKDRAVFSWFGVTSLAVALNGKVILLDTFINGLQPGTCGPDDSQPADPSEPAGYAPVSYEELTALEPRAIFIGHGHYDHECYTGPIAAETGARVIGLPQHCAVARDQAEEVGASGRVECRTPLAADSSFGTKRRLTPIGDRVKVSALRNLHSGAAAQPPMNSNGAESVMYRFRLGRFSLAWNNSAGPLREHAPKLLAKLRDMPATDLQFGATLGFGNPQQGFRDPADYVEALRVRRFYPVHQDLFQNPTLSATFNDQMAAELESRGLGSIFRPLQDPEDYLKRIVVRPDSPRWDASLTSR